MKTGSIRIFCLLMFLCGAVLADNNPPWQQPGEWPDRIVATLASAPAISFSVNWRTAAAVTSTAAEIAPARAATRFDRAAVQIPAISEGFEFDPAWLAGKRHGEGDELLIEPVAYHSVTFTGLEPDTLYAYRVQGAEGKWSAWRQLRTAPVAGPVEFLYFGDSQNGIRSHISRLFDAASLVSPGARFILHAGDLVNSGLNDREWAEWFEAGGSLFGRVPSIPVPGNHDHGSGGKYGLTPYWRVQFNLPVEASLPEPLHEAVYAMHYTPDLHLFAIDSTGPAFGEQLKWLDKQFQDSNARWRIVYMHHPFFSWVGEGIEKPEQTIRRAQLDEFLSRHDVDLVLTGHRHSYQRAEGGPGVHDQDKRQPYGVSTVFLVTASTIKRGTTKVAGWERFSQEREGNISLTRWGDDIPLFGLIRVDGTELTFRAIDATGQAYDAFTLRKQPDGSKVIENGKEAFGPVANLQKGAEEYHEGSPEKTKTEHP